MPVTDQHNIVCKIVKWKEIPGKENLYQTLEEPQSYIAQVEKIWQPLYTLPLKESDKK